MAAAEGPKRPREEEEGSATAAQDHPSKRETNHKVEGASLLHPREIHLMEPPQKHSAVCCRCSTQTSNTHIPSSLPVLLLLLSCTLLLSAPAEFLESMDPSVRIKLRSMFDDGLVGAAPVQTQQCSARA